MPNTRTSPTASWIECGYQHTRTYSGKKIQTTKTCLCIYEAHLQAQIHRNSWVWQQWCPTAWLWAGDRLRQSVRARVHLTLQKGDFSLVELGMLGSGIMHFKERGINRGWAAGRETRQMSGSSGAEKALNRTQLGSCAHRNTHARTNTRTRRGLIGSADKSQAGRITQEERLSFRLLHCRPPGSFRLLCVCGDSNITTITKALTSKNNPSLKSRCRSRSFHSRVVWGMLLLFLKMAARQKVQLKAQYHLSIALVSGNECEILSDARKKSKINTGYADETHRHREGVDKLVWTPVACLSTSQLTWLALRNLL